jgi:hypothetical protein
MSWSKRRKEKEMDRRQKERADKLARETDTGGKLPVAASLFSSSSKKIGAKSILGPKSTPVDVVSPGGQTIRVSVEGVPPSTILDVVCPPVKGVTNPAASVPDASRPPLTILDSATSVDRNLEVCRGLLELELLKLLGQLQEQALHLFLLPLPVRRKRLDIAPLSIRLVVPSPEALFIWT